VRVLILFDTYKGATMIHNYQLLLANIRQQYEIDKLTKQVIHLATVVAEMKKDVDFLLDVYDEDCDLTGV
jgi:archaellum component FlaC